MPRDVYGKMVHLSCYQTVVQNYSLDHRGGHKIDLLRVHGIPYIILEKRRLPENKQNFETRRSLFKLPTNTCKYLRISQL